MIGIRAEDDDPRPGEMVEDPRGYFSRARIRAEQDVTSTTRKPATLGPGIVQMNLRGKTEEMERLVAKMRTEGIVVWEANSRGTRAGNDAGDRDYRVEVPPPAES